MVKCFWCGATNSKATDLCESCKRKLSWSNFFHKMLKPSVGCLLGHETEDPSHQQPVPLAGVAPH